MTVYKDLSSKQLKVHSETNDSRIIRGGFDNFIHNILEQVNHGISPTGIWIGYMPLIPEQARSSQEKLETEWGKEKIQDQELSKPVQLEFEFPDES